MKTCEDNEQVAGLQRLALKQLRDFHRCGARVRVFAARSDRGMGEGCRRWFGHGANPIPLADVHQVEAEAGDWLLKVRCGCACNTRSVVRA
jgi:hypothetical protein